MTQLNKLFPLKLIPLKWHQKSIIYHIIPLNCIGGIGFFYFLWVLFLVQYITLSPFELHWRHWIFFIPLSLLFCSAQRLMSTESICCQVTAWHIYSPIVELVFIVRCCTWNNRSASEYFCFDMLWSSSFWYKLWAEPVRNFCGSLKYKLRSVIFLPLDAWPLDWESLLWFSAAVHLCRLVFASFFTERLLRVFWLRWSMCWISLRTLFHALFCRKL